MSPTDRAMGITIAATRVAQAAVEVQRLGDRLAWRLRERAGDYVRLGQVTPPEVLQQAEALAELMRHLNDALDPKAAQPLRIGAGAAAIATLGQLLADSVGGGT